MGDNENAWEDGNGMDHRRRLKLIMQQYLDAISGGSLKPLHAPPSQPTPPTSSADDSRARRTPTEPYRCYFADGSYQAPIVTPTVGPTAAAEVWPQAAYPHGGWQPGGWHYGGWWPQAAYQNGGWQHGGWAVGSLEWQPNGSRGVDQWLWSSSSEEAHDGDDDADEVPDP